IEDDNLRKKLLNVHLLIANIEALKDNPTSSSKSLTKSSSTSFLEETNNFHNSLHEFENFCFDLEEISSGVTLLMRSSPMNSFTSYLHRSMIVCTLGICSIRIPACCDDDDDYNFANTPVLSIEETDNSLSMGDEHLDTIPATESDEATEIVIPKVEEIKDDNLCEKLNVHLLIANIEALKDNPTQSSEFLTQERHHVLMIDYLSIVETDKVIHTVETDMVKLMVEIESFGMNFDEFDKETGSSVTPSF
nr:hypothetical protein [Tanacetum cinerariifolium]